MTSAGNSNGVLLPKQEDIDAKRTVPVPVALLANPFAHKFAYASQMGKYTLQGKDWNPLNPFCRFMPPGPFHFTGPQWDDYVYCCPIALVVLNSLSRPLALTDFMSQYDSWGSGGHQIAFPAIYDPKSSDSPTEVNRIAGASVYPRNSAHKMEDGSPAMMGGLGVFGFAIEEQYNTVYQCNTAGGACSFSYTQDANGNFIGPYIGVAFWTQRVVAYPGAFQSGVSCLDAVHSAITVDVVGKHGDLQTFFKNAVQNFYETSSDAASITAWCQPEPMGAAGSLTRLVPSPWEGPTLSIWIRDLSSTLG